MWRVYTPDTGCSMRHQPGMGSLFSVDCHDDRGRAAEPALQLLLFDGSFQVPGRAYRSAGSYFPCDLSGSLVQHRLNLAWLDAFDHPVDCLDEILDALNVDGSH